MPQANVSDWPARQLFVCMVFLFAGSVLLEIKSGGKEGAITTIEQYDHKAMTAPRRDDVSFLKGEWKGFGCGTKA